MQQHTEYTDVVAEVKAFLSAQAQKALAAGGPQVVLDPGFGFGKSLAHNLDLLRHFGEVTHAGLPLLAGISRKSMLGAITGQPVGERVSASVAAALLAAQRGAHILRVHDVAATRDALAIWQAVDAG